MESILTSIKKLLGITEDYEAFDDDIIIFINSALMALSQLGACPDGFSIKGKDEIWANLGIPVHKLETVKTYIYLKVRLAFDPPTNSFVIDAINKQINENEWRIILQTERTGIADDQY